MHRTYGASNWQSRGPGEPEGRGGGDARREVDHPSRRRPDPNCQAKPVSRLCRRYDCGQEDECQDPNTCPVWGLAS